MGCIAGSQGGLSNTLKPRPSGCLTAVRSGEVVDIFFTIHRGTFGEV